VSRLTSILEKDHTMRTVDDAKEAIRLSDKLAILDAQLESLSARLSAVTDGLTPPPRLLIDIARATVRETVTVDGQDVTRERVIAGATFEIDEGFTAAALDAIQPLLVAERARTVAALAALGMAVA
jgi:hypothetical protein